MKYPLLKNNLVLSKTHASLTAAVQEGRRHDTA